MEAARVDLVGRAAVVVGAGAGGAVALARFLGTWSSSLLVFSLSSVDISLLDRFAPRLNFITGLGASTDMALIVVVVAVFGAGFAEGFGIGAGAGRVLRMTGAGTGF